MITILPLQPNNKSFNGGHMYKSFLIMLSIVLFASVGLAQDVSNASVAELVFCTAVEEREPVGVDTTFNNSIEQVFCYTTILNAATDGLVTHVWYHNDKEMARVDLNIKGDRWRSWTSKRIIPEWHGTWRVDVLSADGAILKSASFTVLKEEAAKTTN
jgi:hypothetical protein